MPRPKLPEDLRVKRQKQRVTLSNHVWARWQILKQLLQIDSPSKIMDLLIDAWYNSKGIIESKALNNNHSKGIVQSKILSDKTVSEADMDYNADTDVETYDFETTHLANRWPTLEVKTEVTQNGHLAEKGNQDTNECKIQHVNFKPIENGRLDTDNGMENQNFDASKSEVKKQDETNWEIKIEVNNSIEDIPMQSSTDQVKDTPVSGNDIPPHEQGKKRSSDTEQDNVKKKIKRNKRKDKTAEVNTWIKIKLEDYHDKYRLETIESFERKNRKSNVSENLFSCLVCNHFKCASRNTIEDHIEQHINKALECEKCQYVSYCKTDIRKHKRECGQLPKGEYICDLCGIYLTNERRREHMGVVHNIAQWQCRYCSELLTSKKQRLEHMKAVHPELCQFCYTCKKSKWQLSKEDFEKHVENCSLSQACEICGLLISTGAYYSHLSEIHRNIRKHQCTECSYASKCSKRLKTHLLTHAKIHPYKCDQCTFTCVQSSQLKSHMRTHTGEKPYKCTLCKYAAAWNVQLKQHVRFHNMNTGVTCEKCEILFKNGRTLQMHVNKEHSN